MAVVHCLSVTALGSQVRWSIDSPVEILLVMCKNGNLVNRVIWGDASLEARQYYMQLPWQTLKAWFLLSWPTAVMATVDRRQLPLGSRFPSEPH